MAEAKQKDARVWEQDPIGWYVEPERCTDQLAAVEAFAGRTWDPCCGGGNIVRALRRAGVSCHGTDIVRRVPDGTNWFLGERDFLTGRPLPVWSNLVFNPPFFRAKGTEAFIRRGLELAAGNPSAGKMAVFVDLKFLAGDGRANGLFAEHPPHRVWIITPRPSCPPGTFLAAGGEAEGGTADWCWLVWNLREPRRATEFGWLRRIGATA
ncbi:hypothetical protein ACO2RV_17050 [Ancylobacter sp. VNQ12]|uniref:hypothetical protein n=1 Tax=Ancylobacter sp. VNQ12 TaxID=3400920 RepID=UPI003C08379A